MIRRSLPLAVTILLALAGGAAGAPSWDAPLQLSVGARALAPELALNAGGDALVVWDHEIGAVCATQPAALECVHVVEAVTRSRSSAWGAPVEISRPGVDSRPTAGVGGSGDAAIAWVHDIGRDRVLQATYRRGRSGSWPEPNDLSEPTLQIAAPEIAVDAAGNAVAVWAERANTTFAVKAVVRSAASGAWGAPVTLSGGAASAGPSLALTATGEALVAWVEGGSIVRVARGDPANGGWGPPSTVSSSPAPVAGTPTVAVNSTGDAAVAWVQQANGESNPRVQVAYRPRGSNWGTPRSVHPAHLGTPTAPVIAVDRTGNTVVAWLSFGGVEAAARSLSTGTWTGPLVLATPQERAAELQLATDPAGNAVAIWRNGETESVRVALRPGASGEWQPPVTISSSSAARPRVSLDDSGSGHAVWNASAADRVVVDAARLDGTGPIIQRLRSPKRVPVQVSAPLSVEVAAWAASLAGPPRWSFGDGGSATGARTTHAYGKFGRYVISVTQNDVAGGATTAKTTIVVGAPRRTTRPSIRGDVRLGSTLTCLPGSWAGARPIHFAYQWTRDMYAIPGARGPRHRVRIRDLGETLGCRVTAANTLGATAATARPVRPPTTRRSST